MTIVILKTTNAKDNSNLNITDQELRLHFDISQPS